MDKIEVKKTKVSLTISVDTKDREFFSEKEMYMKLLSIGLICGASPNCIRQLMESKKNENIDFGLFRRLKDDMANMIYEAEVEVHRVAEKSGINIKTHSFR